jgi:hypothetical protein
MINFLNKRISIETDYSTALQTLAKNGGVSKGTGIQARNVNEYKNYEEQTLRDAINSMINFTIQESELHREFALQMRSNIVAILESTKDSLASEKKGWEARFDQYKKQVN